MNKAASSTIRLSVTTEVRRALDIAKKRYPTLSDPELLKLGLAKIVTQGDGSNTDEDEKRAIRQAAAHAVGQDYLEDPEEDTYTIDMGTPVHFL